jgi:hypothetical protein
MAFDVPHHEKGQNKKGRLDKEEEDANGEGKSPQFATFSKNHF